tara:strand:+ start:706 stop:1068 length:363 start_codon:yes stop_codon:yes gene_type:complete
MVSKGLGDTIKKITKKTGIDKVAKQILGEDCGCEERRKKLNKMFPYVRQMTDDEIKIFEEVKPSIDKGVLKKNEQKILLNIYNRIFKTNKQVSSCSPCVKTTVDNLLEVYNNSCKNESSI